MEWVEQIKSLGFSETIAIKACLETGNKNVAKHQYFHFLKRIKNFETPMRFKIFRSKFFETPMRFKFLKFANFETHFCTRMFKILKRLLQQRKPS